MPDTPFWEDIEVGHELPTIVKRPSTRQLVKYAGASGDFYEVHYDKDFAVEIGLPGLIVHGALKNAYLGQVVTGWMGPDGVLRKLSVRYRGTDVPGDDLTCSGRVTKVYEQDGAHLVDCALTLQNSQGEQTTTGTATVQLPTKGG
ncbi:MAG: MaoC/PaaZ C-terminal domain-containing protein [Chloroflexota bacterium]|nr:MaoC/PaaZ C-terminal domain-containing protein [Chloroflexota bacterium]MDE2969515.1 MaoC/PaaZ C-terminal domain-containing protein [Chloroflexota bacterium]